MRCTSVCTITAAIILAAGIASPLPVASGQGQPAGARATPDLDPAMEALRGYVGYAWEINTSWESGQSLRARNEYRVGLNGKFVTADTFVKDDKGGEYQRYHSVFAKHPDRPGMLQIHGFTYDGSTDLSEVEIIPAEDGGQPTLRVRGSRKGLDGAPMNLVQEVRLVSETEFTWKVIVLSDEGERVLMNGSYKRAHALK
ncbi:MAG: hypothetical protein KF864_03615 [Phycisphaeraceae bacterium]|nr:hypothetical protein [Phycisphaeraceae bacterium]